MAAAGLSRAFAAVGWNPLAACRVIAEAAGGSSRGRGALARERPHEEAAQHQAGDEECDSLRGRGRFPLLEDDHVLGEVAVELANFPGLLVIGLDPEFHQSLHRPRDLQLVEVLQQELRRSGFRRLAVVKLAGLVGDPQQVGVLGEHQHVDLSLGRHRPRCHQRHVDALRFARPEGAGVGRVGGIEHAAADVQPFGRGLPGDEIRDGNLGRLAVLHRGVNRLPPAEDEDDGDKWKKTSQAHSADLTGGRPVV